MQRVNQHLILYTWYNRVVGGGCVGVWVLCSSKNSFRNFKTHSNIPSALSRRTLELSLAAKAKTVFTTTYDIRHTFLFSVGWYVKQTQCCASAHICITMQYLILSPLYSTRWVIYIPRVIICLNSLWLLRWYWSLKLCFSLRIIIIVWLPWILCSSRRHHHHHFYKVDLYYIVIFFFWARNKSPHNKIRKQFFVLSCELNSHFFNQKRKQESSKKVATTAQTKKEMLPSSFVAI